MLPCSGRASTSGTGSTGGTGQGCRGFPVPSEKAQSIFGIYTRFPALVAERPEGIAFGDGDGTDGCACRGGGAGSAD